MPETEESPRKRGRPAQQPGIGQLLKAVLAVQKVARRAPKTGFNEHHGYHYSTEEDVLDVIIPAMDDNGLLLMFEGIEGEPRVDEHGNTWIIGLFRLCHVNGEQWPNPIRVAGCGNDRQRSGIGDKGLYKAYTGMNKYALLKTFKVATGNDPEQASDADEADVLAGGRRQGGQRPVRNQGTGEQPNPPRQDTRSHEVAQGAPGCPESKGAQQRRLAATARERNIGPEKLLEIARTLPAFGWDPDKYRIDGNGLFFGLSQRTASNLIDKLCADYPLTKSG